MKKRHLTIGIALALCGSLTFSSCIGKFALTNSVLTWNNQIGDKFLNELVFFAFLVLPVYEVTAVADILVLNSIEFWSGTNPLTASTKVVEGENGRYIVACDGKGYTITDEATDKATRLNYDEKSLTWSLDVNGVDYPFMTMVDENHVKMITPEGDMRLVELSQQGVLAYSQTVKNNMMTASR